MNIARIHQPANTMQIYRIKPDGSALRQWDLNDAPLIVGRDIGATVRIPDYKMSGKHFVILRDGEALQLLDLNSTTGTWVNGIRVTTRRLSLDDLVVAGRTLFSFQAGDIPVLQRLEAKKHAHPAPAPSMANLNA